MQGLLPDAPAHVGAVGRLDLETTGLIAPGLRMAVWQCGSRVLGTWLCLRNNTAPKKRSKRNIKEAEPNRTNRRAATQHMRQVSFWSRLARGRLLEPSLCYVNCCWSKRHECELHVLRFHTEKMLQGELLEQTERMQSDRTMV